MSRHAFTLRTFGPGSQAGVSRPAPARRIASRCAALALAGVMLTGCAGLNDTEQRVLTGAVIGAGAGAGVGAVTGGLSIAAGAAIGAAAGAVGGLAVDTIKKQ